MSVVQNQPVICKVCKHPYIKPCHGKNVTCGNLLFLQQRDAAPAKKNPKAKPSVNGTHLVVGCTNLDWLATVYRHETGKELSERATAAKAQSLLLKLGIEQIVVEQEGGYVYGARKGAKRRA